MRLSGPRRLACLLARPLALAATGACDEDDDPPPVQTGSGGSAGSSAGGSGNFIPDTGRSTQGSGGELTGNGNHDGDPRAPADPPVVGGPGGMGAGTGVGGSN